MLLLFNLIIRPPAFPFPVLPGALLFFPFAVTYIRQSNGYPVYPVKTAAR